MTLAAVLTVSVALFASLASGLAGAWVARWLLLRRVQVLPSLPSYVEATGREADAAVGFHAAVHDVVMTVTEAWNAAGARRIRPPIEAVIDRERLAEHSAVLRERAAILRDRFERYRDVIRWVDEARSAVASVWVHTQEDHSTTILVPVFISDGKGGGSMSMQTQTVYSHTDHRFTRDEEALQGASLALRTLQDVRGDRRVAQLMLEHQRVDLDALAEGERALAERLVALSVTGTREEVSPIAVRTALNQWLRGAAMDGHIEQLNDQLDRAPRLAEHALAASRVAEPDYKTRTKRRSDPGPPAAQAMAALGSSLDEARKRYEWLLDTLDEGGTVASKLTQWALDPTVVEQDRAYIAQATKLYKRVFPASELELAPLPGMGLPAVVGMCCAFVAGSAVLVVGIAVTAGWMAWPV